MSEPSPQAYKNAAAIAYDALMRLAEKNASDTEVSAEVHAA